MVSRLDSPLGWAFRVGSNLGASHFRRRRAEQRALQRLGPPRVAQADPDDARDLRAALQALPRRQRECIVLRHYLDFSADEVGAVLGISPGAFRALTHRAMNSLRADLHLSPASEGVHNAV